MNPTRSEPIVAVLDEVWTSTIAACDGLEPAAWELPTDCPGWTVRDQLSHLIGIERMLLGESSPALDGPVPEHVLNPIGEMNEAWVQARRGLPGPVVLAEFAEVTQRRLSDLRGFGSERFEEVGWSPVGEVPYREFMVVRVFDSWAHEQDARRALGRVGGRGGGGEAVTLDRVTKSMGYVVGRKVSPAEGTTVVWEVTGPLPRTLAVTVTEGKGRVVDPVPPDPTVRIVLDADSFWRLGCGRTGADAIIDSAAVSFSGDATLGRRVLENMNFMM
jgi:uncharacterized protein (TIGR03083 family)